MEGAQIQDGGQQIVTVGSFAAKYRSKSEIYSFLTVSAMVYLPPQPNVTLYFLKAVIGGQKKL